MQTVYREVVGEVQEDSEVLLIAKVRTADARLVIDFVTKSSPTDTAEIYTLPVRDRGWASIGPILKCSTLSSR